MRLERCSSFTIWLRACRPIRSVSRVSTARWTDDLALSPPLLSYPPPPPTHFQRPTWAWHHQLLNASGPKMAPQLLLWHTEKSLTDSSCWAETGQGHSQNEIHRLYLRKHQVLTWLLDQSGLGKLQ